MAYGDSKSSRSSGGYGRVSYGRSETQAERDAQARASSKAVLDEVKGKANPCAYLLQAAEEGYLLSIYRTTHQITTYGKYDWERIMELLEPDCRAKVLQALEKAQEQDAVERQERQEKLDAEYTYRQMVWAQEAEARKQAEYEQKTAIVNQAQLVLGSIQSETSQVFYRKERYELDQGDYLEDVVANRLRSGGWIEETTRRGGFKLQVTASLDVSNSMVHNRVWTQAIKAFTELVIAIRSLKDEHPDDVAYSAWLFCLNRDGKGVEQLLDYTSRMDWTTRESVKTETDDPMKEVRKLFNVGAYFFSGEDSYIYPLLQHIRDWEAQEVTEGYTRLDIILSDGTFERKVDITTADEVQASRGQVHTVILNFMPEELWYTGRLPYQCVQYGVTADNVGGILRLVLAQFLEAYI